jgi:predicted metal-dependent phosphoesterase TrpH
VGGLAAWAHPNELDGRDWHAYLPLVLEAKIDGLEVYYSKDYGPDLQQQLLEACAAHDLLPTVGSDFHGFSGMDRPPGSVACPPDLLDRLEQRVSARRRAGGG